MDMCTCVHTTNPYLIHSLTQSLTQSLTHPLTQQVYIGGGKSQAAATDDPSRAGAELCGVQLPWNSRAEVCKGDSARTCIVQNIRTHTCVSDDTKTFPFIMLDDYGDGWGEVSYRVTDVEAGVVVKDGTLTAGQVKVDEHCLEVDKSYLLSVQGTSSHSNTEDLAEVVWVACGFVGGAPANFHFTVKADGGCVFSSVGYDEWWYNDLDDDDFPDGAFMPDPAAATFAPTVAPTLLSGADEAAVAPTLLPTRAPVIAVPTMAPSALPTR